MINIKKKPKLITTAALCLIYLISFLLNYIAIYVSSGTAIIFISAYFSEMISTLLPPIAALLMLITYADKGLRSGIGLAFIYAACGVIYRFPIAAFDFAYSGYAIGDVLILSLLYSAAELLFNAALYAVLFLIMLLVMRRLAKEPSRLKFELSKKASFDFSEPISAAVIAAAMPIFISKLIIEIIDTVSFFIKYYESFNASEVFTMVFRYIFILALFILSYVLTFAVKVPFCEKDPNSKASRYH